MNTIIVIGCESHTDESFATSEVFPSNFTVFCKDRSIGGGGVFLCFENTLDVSEEPTLQVDAELIWARLKLHKRQPIYICSYCIVSSGQITFSVFYGSATTKKN